MKPGEERDFRAFVDRSLPSLRPLAGALTGGAAAAEELLSSTLATLARRWHRLDAAPEPYATRLLYRAYAGRRTPMALATGNSAGFGVRTAAAVRAGAEVSGGSSAGSSSAVGADAAVSGGSGARDLDGRDAEAAAGHLALDQLAPRCRALLVLRYFERRDDAEAASILGTSAVAVTGEITAALEQLHEAWSRAAGGELRPAFDLEAQVETRFRELAEASAAAPTATSAADLAAVALAHGLSATRQRLGIGLGIGAAATVTGLVLATSLVGGEAADVTPGGDSGPVLTLELAGQSVITSYFDGQELNLLDPETGEYHRWTGQPGTTSPDLRTVATVRPFMARSEVRVWSVPERERLMSTEVPGPGAAAVWSPDGSWLAVVLASHEQRWFSELALVEVATGEVEVVELAVAPGRAATWFGNGAGVSWLDPQRLAVPTGEAERLLPHPRPGFVELPMVDAIGVFDRDGELLEELPIDPSPWAETAQPHGGTGWSPYGFLGDGRCIFTRSPQPGTWYVAAEPLVADPPPYESIGLRLPDPDDPVNVWATRVTGSFGTTVIVEASQTPDHTHPDFVPGNNAEAEQRTYLADFGPGGPGMEQVDLTTVLPLPTGAQPDWLTFGDATWLSPAASHLAFTR